MITLYYWPTPNGHKITMALEELGLPYRVSPVDITRGEQFDPAFVAISPGSKMPAIVDDEPSDGEGPLALFESGAILNYLAEKTGRLMPRSFRGRHETLAWLFWQVGGLGPMAGQNGHFSQFASEKIPYAIDRYVKETARLYGVLERRMDDRTWIAGDDYTIADIASYPWIVPHERHGQRLGDFPNLERWFEAVRARPATIRAYEVPRELKAA